MRYFSEEIENASEFLEKKLDSKDAYEVYRLVNKYTEIEDDDTIDSIKEKIRNLSDEDKKDLLKRVKHLDLSVRIARWMLGSFTLVSLVALIYFSLRKLMHKKKVVNFAEDLSEIIENGMTPSDAYNFMILLRDYIVIEDTDTLNDIKAKMRELPEEKKKDFIKKAKLNKTVMKVLRWTHGVFSFGFLTCLAIIIVNAFRKNKKAKANFSKDLNEAIEENVKPSDTYEYVRILKKYIDINDSDSLSDIKTKLKELPEDKKKEFIKDVKRSKLFVRIGVSFIAALNFSAAVYLVICAIKAVKGTLFK